MSDTITIPTVEVEFKPGTRLFWGKQNVMRVLEVDREHDTALLIAERPVCDGRYHSKWEDITWEHCDLRAWLNGEYYDTAFSEEEKEAILETHLSNPDNPKYNTPGGNDTDDRIFLLSIDEAEKYFKDDADRATGSWWWLRSPGGNGSNAASVYGVGGIILSGSYVHINGVRPAFKNNLKSDIFQSIILSESDESIILKIPELNISEGTLYGSLPGVTGAEIPEGVTKIAKRCFSGRENLRSVSLPKTLEMIGEEAFSGCAGLTSVSIPESVTSIGKGAFTECGKLKSAAVPDTLSAEMLYEAGLIMGIGDAGMTDLIAAAKKWEKDCREKFYRAYLRSDTRAAILLAEKRKELDKYAAMRGMDADEIRDRFLSDLGLDMHGRKSCDLGNMTVAVRMNPDFTFTVELPDGKVSKSLPKKGSDPEKYDAANKDLAQIKKDVKKIWKNRADLLLADFISGKARTAEYWKNAYGGNPILHAMACLLVWEQGGKTFRRTDDGLITADGSAYELTDEPVRVAHPIETEAAELEAWRKHFTSRGLKQPFAQIWERAYDPGEIAQDRYAGCPIIFFQLQGAEKHGFNQDLNIPGCKVEAKWSTETAANGNKVSYCDIQSFTIEKYSRAVNHALAYLDRVTIAGRIAKDDTDVMRSVEGCNVAQVTEYIGVAQEAQAVNVLALLMEYKNTHFADFDPMDEFTLE